VDAWTADARGIVTLVKCLDTSLIYFVLTRVCNAQDDIGVRESADCNAAIVWVHAAHDPSFAHSISLSILYLQAPFPPSNTLNNFKFFQMRLNGVWGERSPREGQAQGQRTVENLAARSRREPKARGER